VLVRARTLMEAAVRSYLRGRPLEGP